MYEQIKTRENYDKLLKSGMFWEFHPELTGDWDKDKLVILKTDDKYLEDNIVEARNNHDKACDVYRNYVGKAETWEERKERINRFRSGGW